MSVAIMQQKFDTKRPSLKRHSVKMKISINLEKNNRHHIKSIYAKGIFGRYSYSLPSANESLSDINILYGQNGAGKTTLLSLVFHMLSSSASKGHRNAIAKIPFASVKVVLNDGTTLSAEKDKQLLMGPVTFKVKSPMEEDVVWELIPGETYGSFRAEDLPMDVDVNKIPPGLKNQVKRVLEQRNFFEKLSKLSVNSFMLTSDRLLLGDSISDSSIIEPQFDYSKVRGNLAQAFMDYRAASVKAALSNASYWLQSKFVDKSYGTKQSINPYYDVVKKIANTTDKTRISIGKNQEEKIKEHLIYSIMHLDFRAGEFSKFGLAAQSLPTDIVPYIGESHGSKLSLINSILEPYIDGLSAKLDGLESIYSLVHIFVGSVNKFFKDKRMEYSIKDGFKIFLNIESAKPLEIDPGQLSSGEQQLILLFCYVLVTRDKPSIFIIDEPEISLNIMWQRMLVATLQELSEGSDIQFLFASHSLEILSKHRNRVISLQEM